MPKRIVLVQGHPDPPGGHFGHALAAAYQGGAREAGHAVDTIAAANHLAPVYPLWLGTMPADLRASLEQLLRPWFAPPYRARVAREAPPRGCHRGHARGLLPDHRGHGVKKLDRNAVRPCGFGRVRHSLAAAVEASSRGCATAAGGRAGVPPAARAY